MAENDAAAAKSRERRIQELKVLEHEINCLKRNACVYKQQPNSNIFFKSTRADVEQDTKRNLDALQARQNSEPSKTTTD
ncbi:ASNSD1 upstream open reading frame protein-like [Dermacentor andersoni]|uniref:ASNSD1 upstream open reading frame protein-like n=1 Tax=Dermacentor andersoni TaxID=34620 RepID=UPI002155A069|nr:ASNSD1 upstream open reading frame protein-like [Dermacentor andersoni]